MNPFTHPPRTHNRLRTPHTPPEAGTTHQHSTNGRAGRRLARRVIWTCFETEAQLLLAAEPLQLHRQLPSPRGLERVVVVQRAHLAARTAGLAESAAQSGVPAAALEVHQVLVGDIALSSLPALPETHDAVAQRPSSARLPHRQQPLPLQHVPLQLLADSGHTELPQYAFREPSCTLALRKCVRPRSAVRLRVREASEAREAFDHFLLGEESGVLPRLALGVVREGAVSGELIALPAEFGALLGPVLVGLEFPGADQFVALDREQVLLGEALRVGEEDVGRVRGQQQLRGQRRLDQLEDMRRPHHRRILAEVYIIPSIMLARARPTHAPDAHPALLLNLKAKVQQLTAVVAQQQAAIDALKRQPTNTKIAEMQTEIEHLTHQNRRLLHLLQQNKRKSTAGRAGKKKTTNSCVKLTERRTVAHEYRHEANEWRTEYRVEPKWHEVLKENETLRRQLVNLRVHESLLKQRNTLTDKTAILLEQRLQEHDRLLQLNTDLQAELALTQAKVRALEEKAAGLVRRNDELEALHCRQLPTALLIPDCRPLPTVLLIPDL